MEQRQTVEEPSIEAFGLTSEVPRELSVEELLAVSGAGEPAVNLLAFPFIQS